MTQDEAWLAKCKDVVSFIQTNKRNPSRYNPIERGLYVNWLRHNRKLFNSGEMKEKRVKKFKELLELEEKYKRINQYL